ncbi:MAG: ABC transporter permease [Bacteroidales bacterium]|nr:ABC transporter permease [Bacteroidales bacterium]
MKKNILKHSIRALNRQKNHTLINIIGLSIGIACSLLITLFVINELSYDKFHVNEGRIFRVGLCGKIGGDEMNTSASVSPLGPTMLIEFPEVENFCRYCTRARTIKYKNKSYVEDYCAYADSSFFNIFSFQLLRGNKNSILNRPKTIIISKSFAQKIFGDQEAIGKMLYIGKDTSLYEVTGIMADMPNNSSFRANIIISFISDPGAVQKEWMSNSYETYILLKEGASPEAINAKFEPLLIKYVSPMFKQYLGVTYNEFIEQGNKYNYYLQPLSKIHLNPDIKHQLKPQSNPKFIYIFSGIAIFIIIIASINFMNLSTAQAAKRAKEVAIKKIIGASRFTLIMQFLLESIVLSLISLLIAIATIEIFLPFFNNILNSNLSVDYLNWKTLIIFIFIPILVGLLAGSYPAFILSSFKPIRMLKGKTKDNMKNGGLRKVLVIVQFSISIALIIGTLIIFKQIKYILNKDIGFKKENLLVIENAFFLDDQNAFKEEISKLPGVVSSSTSTAVPFHTNRGNLYILKGHPEESYLIETNYVDHDFFKTYGIKLKSGRFFDLEKTTDIKACIINQSTVNAANLEKPLENQLILPSKDLTDEKYHSQIIGTIENFHFRSLHTKIGTYMFKLLPPNSKAGYLSIRLDKNNINKTLIQIEKIWGELSNNEPIAFFFSDQDFKNLYKEEQQNSKLAIIFTILAIIIASLGLFGLTSFTIEQRTKEIGIRKSLGASINNILYIISKEIVILVNISIIIAWPCIYFGAKSWLQNYHYKINLNIVDFIIGFIIALLVALITISYKTIKAAKLNPAQSLRYE